MIAARLAGVVRGRRLLGGAVALAVALAMAAAAAPGTAFGAGAAASAAGDSNVNLLGAPQGLDDVDMRTGSVAPTDAQLSMVSGLGATARWNRFGTVHSLIRYGGYLGTGLSSNPVTAARSWVSSHAALFRLTTSDVAALEVLNDSPLRGSAGHAVLFRQRYGTLPAGQDGLISVGVIAGKVTYVSSSSAGHQDSGPVAATLSPTAAWQAAADNVGRTTAADLLSTPQLDRRTGWTVFTAAGFAQLQRARLVAVPLFTGGVRPAYETNVVDSQRGLALAYTMFVDAVSGNVLMRYNRAQQNQQTQTFSGAFTPTTCGPLHPYTVDAATKSIDVVASATIPTNDIVLNLIHNSITVASSDTATSPEAIHYTGTGGIIDPGVYNVQVCPFNPPMVPFVPPFTYAGVFESNDVQQAQVPYPPKWKYFFNAPPLTYASTDTRKVGCWVTSIQGVPVPGCDRKEQNLASRGPWDYSVTSNTPSFTTLGNNASTAESWFSPLTPGPLGQRPVKPNREYTDPWTNAWYESKCNPAVFALPARNDIDASVTNLFAGHNRFHDFSYFLGFTEDNYNAQMINFGNTAPGPYPTGREQDPETGDVQAGAISGGAPSYLGRDNANQITLQDGIAPITNQYLFQPIAGAFYAPCVDGDLDATVFGHEYTHLISNRMVAGPDSGLNGYQAGSMGESWSDLVALEYLQEYKYAPQEGENPWAVGPYATGNKAVGIRNYALNANPLNYSDLGYDTGGPEVHSDGEVWNAVNYDIRQALVAKYNGAFPAGNAALQAQCAGGVLPADRCPGNRRWVQLMFDAFLLQGSGTDMLDARDALLAADVSRFGGANQKELWREFARNGMGSNASTTGTGDNQPIPGFETPAESNEATLTFIATDMTTGQTPVAGKLYVGNYEARVTPIRTTTTSTTPVAVKFVPGTYSFVFQANGYGLRRFSMTLGAGQTVQRVLHMSPNLASKYNGATITSSTGGVNNDNLIDDTEGTNWAALNQAAGVNTTKPSATVQLAGSGPQMVRSVQVSALLRPDPNDDDPNDPGNQNRFTALRQFGIDVCTASLANGNCTLPVGFTRLYTSPDNAFPGVAPRPLAPNLNLRVFDVPDTMATHVRLVALHNQCTGGPAYQGDQDNDPLNNSDCKTGSVQDTKVRAAELEVYSFDATTRPPGDPVVVTTMTAPATAATGSTITYNIGYTNLGPAPASSSKLTDALPAGVTFVSATNGATYNAGTRTVTWSLGTVPVGVTGSVQLKVKITALPPAAILNQANFTAALTVGLPCAALTVVEGA